MDALRVINGISTSLYVSVLNCSSDEYHFHKSLLCFDNGIKPSPFVVFRNNPNVSGKLVINFGGDTFQLWGNVFLKLPPVLRAPVTSLFDTVDEKC